MSGVKIKDILNDCCNDITFSVNNMKCGIFPTVTNSKPSYDVWIGDVNNRFYSVDEVMNAPIFAGKTLTDICDSIVFQTW